MNDYALEHGFGNFYGSEFIVNISRMRRGIVTKGKIVSGHLLPYVIPNSKIDFVAVLRCSPKVLRRRYLKRKYGALKIRENLEAELIGVVSSKALEVYGRRKLGEFDTSRYTPNFVARRILRTIRGEIESSFGKIDWLLPQYLPQELIKAFQQPFQNHKG